jgi:hypothetical protein
MRDHGGRIVLMDFGATREFIDAPDATVLGIIKPCNLIIRSSGSLRLHAVNFNFRGSARIAQKLGRLRNACNF